MSGRLTEAQVRAPKICICGWRFAAGKCPYPIDCKIKVEPFQQKPQQGRAALAAAKEGRE